MYNFRMSIISKLLGSRSKSAPLIYNVSTFSGFDNAIDIKSLNGYRDSLYVYIAVSKIAKRAAGIPLELYRIKNKRGDVTEVMDHPLLALMSKPNQHQTGREFKELSFTHYLLSGDCFWLITRTGTTITELTPLRPDWVQIVMSPDGKKVMGYEYTAVQVYKFAPEDVVHIRNVDPENPLRGMGVMRPARSRILAEKEATSYQANFFKNQGRPDMLVFSDSEVNEEAADDFRARWKRIFGGNQSGQVGVFGNRVKEVREANKTPKEMDFIESQKFLRDDIAAAFHVPKAMLTSDDVNLNNAKESYRMFLQEAVVPVLEAFIDVMNNRLVPTVDMNVFFDFQDPTPVDREMLLKEATQLKEKGIITANEARALFNYEAMEGHDELHTAPKTPDTTEQIADKAKAIIRNRPVLAKKLEAIERTLEVLISNEPKRQMNSIFATKSMKDAYAKAYNERVDRKADVLAEAIIEYHKGLEERILKSDLGLSTFMDTLSEKITARNAFEPILVKLYKEGGQAALDALFKKSTTDFFATEELLASLTARLYFFTDSMTETTHEILRAKIADGIANGDSVDVIAGKVREYFKDMGQKRALTIARTETGFALSKATNDAYNQSVVVTGKEWITVGDDKVRDEHKMNDGVIVAKGASFPNGEHYPAEHSVNCRCVLAPAV